MFTRAEQNQWKVGEIVKARDDFWFVPLRAYLAEVTHVYGVMVKVRFLFKTPIPASYNHPETPPYYEVEANAFWFYRPNPEEIEKVRLGAHEFPNLRSIDDGD